MPTPPSFATAAAAPVALVLGATGGFGGAVASALLAAGWRVRAMGRDPERGRVRQPALEWVAGDAMRAKDVLAAARGVQLLVHGVNPPGYRHWDTQAVPMLQHSITAARASGARLVFPGNVYNFGPNAGSVVDESAPQHPATRKGAIRVRMEQMLAAAAVEGVRSLVLRAGDFFGPDSPGSWLGAVMVRPGRPVRSVRYPGRPQAGHAWAYLPDLAQAVVRLLARQEALADFEVFHFGGHWLAPGEAMADAIRRAAGQPNAPIRRFPWGLVALASPVVPLMRELREMKYLWDQPLRLDNRKLLALLGEEPHTPLDEALRVTLAGLGCLPVAPAQAAA